MKLAKAFLSPLFSVGIEIPSAACKTIYLTAAGAMLKGDALLS